MKKLLFILVFVSSATAGASCSSDLKDACDDYVYIRDTCEGLTPPEPEEVPKYSIDMCANIDPECQAYFECAILAPCEEDSRGKYRLNVSKLNKLNQEAAEAANIEFVECKQPENKACTDADLRP